MYIHIYTYIHTNDTYIQIIHTYISYIHTHTHTHTHTETYIYIYIYIYIYRYRYMCIHLQLRMTCRKIIPWSSGSRNTCDVCTWIGGGWLPTNSCRSACVSFCGCTIVWTCHGRRRSSRCRQALFALPASQKIAVRNSACRCVPFSETRAEIKRSSFLLYLLSIASRAWETSDPPCSILPLITNSISCHWKFRMDVAATHTHRYKHTP